MLIKKVLYIQLDSFCLLLGFLICLVFMFLFVSFGMRCLFWTIVYNVL